MRRITMVLLAALAATGGALAQCPLNHDEFDKLDASLLGNKREIINGISRLQNERLECTSIDIESTKLHVSSSPNNLVFEVTCIDANGLKSFALFSEDDLRSVLPLGDSPPKSIDCWGAGQKPPPLNLASAKNNLREAAAGDALLDIGGGIVARVFSDGSGLAGTREEVTSFGNAWSVRIKKDEITDESIIYTTRKPYFEYQGSRHDARTDLRLYAEFSNKNGEILCVSGHDFPGKKAIIRIDSNPAIETNEHGCLALTQSLNNEIRQAKELTLRGYVWPYESPETHKVNLGGYSAISNFLRSKR